ncbi:uncharacterized protein LOC100179559 [Ciona intestinalis]
MASHNCVHAGHARIQRRATVQQCERFRRCEQNINRAEQRLVQPVPKMPNFVLHHNGKVYNLRPRGAISMHASQWRHGNCKCPVNPARTHYARPSNREAPVSRSDACHNPKFAAGRGLPMQVVKIESDAASLPENGDLKLVRFQRRARFLRQNSDEVCWRNLQEQRQLQRAQNLRARTFRRAKSESSSEPVSHVGVIPATRRCRPSKKERAEQRSFRLKRWTQTPDDSTFTSILDASIPDSKISIQSSELFESSSFGVELSDRKGVEAVVRARNNAAKITAAMAAMSQVANKSKIKKSDSGVWCEKSPEAEQITGSNTSAQTVSQGAELKQGLTPPTDQPSPCNSNTLHQSEDQINTSVTEVKTLATENSGDLTPVRTDVETTAPCCPCCKTQISEPTVNPAASSLPSPKVAQNLSTIETDAHTHIPTTSRFTTICDKSSSTSEFQRHQATSNGAILRNQVDHFRNGVTTVRPDYATTNFRSPTGNATNPAAYAVERHTTDRGYGVTNTYDKRHHFQDVNRPPPVPYCDSHMSALARICGCCGDDEYSQNSASKAYSYYPYGTGGFTPLVSPAFPQIPENAQMCDCNCPECIKYLRRLKDYQKMKGLKGPTSTQQPISRSNRKFTVSHGTETGSFGTTFTNYSGVFGTLFLCFRCFDGKDSDTLSSGGSDTGNDSGDDGEEEGEGYVEHGDGVSVDGDSDGGDSGSDSGGEVSMNSAELFDDANNMFDIKTALGEGEDSDGGPGSNGSDCSDSLTELRSRSKKGSGSSDEGEEESEMTQDEDDFMDSWESLAILERE